MIFFKKCWMERWQVEKYYEVLRENGTYVEYNKRSYDYFMSFPKGVRKWKKILTYDYFNEVWKRCNGSAIDFASIVKGNIENDRLKKRNVYKGSQLSLLK